MYYYRRNSSTVPILIALPPETDDELSPTSSPHGSALTATISLPRRPTRATATVWRPSHRVTHRASYGAPSYHGSFRHTGNTSLKSLTELEETQWSPKKPDKSWYFPDDSRSDDDITPPPTDNNPKGTLNNKKSLPPTPCPSIHPSESQTPFTIFTPLQKRLIIFAASFAAMFLALNGLIYFPALTLIAEDMDVSLMMVQLTITSSLVVAGLVPAFTGDIADNGGRRPVYLVMFALMICANVGIAVQGDYPALLLLRMLQGAGSSGMLGFAYGVIADVTSIEERGSFVGFLLLMADIAASVGPVVGGGLTQILGWRSIFWFLVILTGTHFIGMILFFPETQRNIVGNGGVDPPEGWGIIYKSVYAILRNTRTDKRRINQEKHFFDDDRVPIIVTFDDQDPPGYQPRKGPTVTVNEIAAEAKSKQKFRLPNPLACLKIVTRCRGSLVVVSINAVNSAVKAAMQASLGAQCVKIYGLTYLQAGLVYIPSGMGGSVGAYAAGRFVDWNYRRWQSERHSQENENRGEKESSSAMEFPLERIRLRGLHFLSLVTVLGLVGFGLALEVRAHIAVMLILQLLMGASTAAAFTLCGTLLTDLNTTKSATAQAADNLARCTSAAGAVAILQPLFQSMRPAKACMVYASTAALCFPLGWILKRMGSHWRRLRAAP